MNTHPPLDRGPEVNFETGLSQPTLPNWFVNLSSQPGTTATGAVPPTEWQAAALKP